MSTVTKRRISSPRKITTRKVMNEVENVGLTLAGIYTGALINKPLSAFIEKVVPSQSVDNAGTAPLSGLTGMLSEYGAPSGLLLAGLVTPMVVDFGKNKTVVQSVLKGMAIYGGTSIIKNIMGRNLLAGHLGTVTTNFRELNAARITELPVLSTEMTMSV